MGVASEPAGLKVPVAGSYSSAESKSARALPAVPQAMPGNIIADFPLINKSFNLSYSG